MSTNTITGIFALIVFLSFVIGLAVSINSVPFIIIVSIIGLLALYDFYESVRDERKK
jgi:4-hydroxybenzoate polyprenyltransferase